MQPVTMGRGGGVTTWHFSSKVLQQMDSTCILPRCGGIFWFQLLDRPVHRSHEGRPKSQPSASCPSGLLWAIVFLYGIFCWIADECGEIEYL